MAHYAKIENDIVTYVIVAEQDFINTIDGEWVQTSYNTIEGKHVLGGTPLRKNYAGIGYTYNRVLDAFILPQPFPSWILDTEKGIYLPPFPCPNNDYIKYQWDEITLNWIPRIV